MKKRIFLLVFTALSILFVMTAAAEEILYTGTVTKDMTIREKQSTSAKKLGSVEEGGLINIIEYGDTWTKVDQDGLVGYVLSKNVEDLAAADGYNDEADALYLGVATKELTIRKTQSKSAQRMRRGDGVYPRAG